jgi:hypothetical protein
MSSRTLIKCDACGKEEQCPADRTLPAKWGDLTMRITVYEPSTGAKHEFVGQLCPECIGFALARKERGFWPALIARGTV